MITPIDQAEVHPLPRIRAPELLPKQVHVWLIDLDQLPTPAPIDSVFVAAPNRYLIGQRFWLRMMLGAYLGLPGKAVRIARASGKKPTLAPEHGAAALHFNVSHTGSWLALALARGVDPGIDIEYLGRNVRWAALARRWFGPGEADWLETLAPDYAAREFLRRWSLREAMVKAQGASLARTLSDLGLASRPDCAIERLPPDWPEPETWRCVELTFEKSLTGWLAATSPVDSVRAFRLDPSQ